MITFPVVLMKLYPVPHTDPTELILTALTSHVITSTVFFNLFMTLWTWSCIC